MKYVSLTYKLIQMSEEKKNQILRALKEVYPCDLCVVEIADKVGISRITASRYIAELKGEGKIEVTRKFGKVVFYRLKK